MAGVICAIRGGPHSQPTIKQAISIARESGIPIYFLYVVNLDFLLHTEHSRTHTLLQELREMGEFILLTARLTAEKEGVTAYDVVREGQVGEEIINLGKEVSADYIVLGLPRAGDEKNVFNLEKLRNFTHQIEQETRAKVVFSSRDDS